MIDYCLESCDNGDIKDCDTQPVPSNGDKKPGYYRCKKKHATMYKQMSEKYQRYITRDMLQMVLHFFDTQKNEAMNTSIMKYAPKSKTYCKTLSLKVRVCIAASTNCTGHELFWKKVLQRMKLEMSSELQARLQYMDRMKENTIASKNKRSKGKYEAIKKARAEQAKAASEGRDYGDDHNQGSKKESTNNCKHAIFGCNGLGSHKTSKSTKCKFHQIHEKINDKTLGEEGIRLVLIREGYLKNDFLQTVVPICEDSVVVRHAHEFSDVNDKKCRESTVDDKTQRSCTNSTKDLNCNDRMIFLDGLEPSDSE